MSQTIVVRFKESPFSPWGASNRAVSRGTGTNLLQNATQKRILDHIEFKSERFPMSRFSPITESVFSLIAVV